MNLAQNLQDAATRIQDPVSGFMGNAYMENLNTSNPLKDPVASMKSALETWKGDLAMMSDIIREASYPTPLSVSPLLPFLLLSLARQKNSPNTKTFFKTEYDYIVVGAGSAGSVVASRLSELNCATVLLLEAGKSPPLLTDVPLLAGSYRDTDIDWNYKTVPQKHAAYAHVNRELPFCKGKVIGGSSIMNNMLYNRGHRKNYDGWAQNGAAGWNWNNVFPVFLKSENNTNPDFVKNGYHGVGGPLTVSQIEIDPLFKDVIPEVAADLGYSFHDASGPGGQIGVINLQGTIRDNQRCSTAKAYLVPAENRSNFDIVKEAFVTKILVDNSTAEGVLFDYNGTRYEVKARKEIIISAGAVNTPQLLMLSGIGPKETLDKFGIPVLADLPVGKNFHDHAGTMLNFQVNVTPLDRFLIQGLNPVNTLQYIKDRSGFLAESTGLLSISFSAKGGEKTQETAADSEEYLGKGVQELMVTKINMKPLVYAKLYAPYLLTSMIFCLAEGMHPRSRGYVTLQSADPYDPPLIDPNYYSDAQDLEDVVSGMKMCLKLMSSPAMKKFNPRIAKTLMPGCEKYAQHEDQTNYLKCYARSFVIPTSHDVGTAKMGDPSDATTVVGPDLRVKGIDKLRVADASVIPSIPTGNTNSPIIVIGEKAADMIKQDFRCR